LFKAGLQFRAAYPEGWRVLHASPLLRTMGFPRSYAANISILHTNDSAYMSNT
jgi:hypothetical protein